MFRSTFLRRMVTALCVALMMGGVVSVGEIVAGDDARVPLAFALHTDVHAQECTDDGGGGDQGDRPECERGEAGGGGGGSGCGLWCWVGRLLQLCKFIPKEHRPWFCK